MAAQYDLGAVAQLAERSAGSRKVGGSNPPSSTSKGEDPNSLLYSPGARLRRPNPLPGMNEKPAPRHVTRFVEELVECGVQLARMLDHMYLHESPDPDTPFPPWVLRDLVAKTIEPDVASRKRDLYTATGLLLETSKTIERELFLVDPGSLDEDDVPPGAFDDLEPSDFDTP